MKTNKLVQGAMMAALFGTLSLFNTYTGSFLDALIGYFMVVPFAWYGYKYTLRDNVMAVIASLIVVFMTGIPSFLIIAVSACLSGLWIGECLRRHTSGGVMFLGNFLITLAETVLTYTVFSALLGIDLMSEMREIYEMVGSVMKITVSWQVFRSLIPSIFLLEALLQCYVIILLCQALLMRFKVPFPKNFHIAEFRVSKPLGFLLVAGLVVTMICQSFFNFNNIVFYYAYLLFMFPLILQGLACLSIWLFTKGYGRMTGLIFLPLLIPNAAYIIAALGVVDIFGDLREKIVYNSYHKRK